MYFPHLNLQVLDKNKVLIVWNDQHLVASEKEANMAVLVVISIVSHIHTVWLNNHLYHSILQIELM